MGKREQMEFDFSGAPEELDAKKLDKTTPETQIDPFLTEARPSDECQYCGSPYESGNDCRYCRSNPVKREYLEEAEKPPLSNELRSAHFSDKEAPSEAIMLARKWHPELSDQDLAPYARICRAELLRKKEETGRFAMEKKGKKDKRAS